MTKVVKRSRILLIIGVIFLFIVFPVYFHLSALDDLDTVSPYLCFRAADEEDSVVTLEHKEKVFVPTFVVKQHSEINPLLERIPACSLCVFAPCSKPLFLRC